jgi:hypothetical protein
MDNFSLKKRAVQLDRSEICFGIDLDRLLEQA